MINRLSIISSLIILVYSCGDNLNCNSKRYTVLEENSSNYGASTEYSYDIEFPDLDRSCVNNKTIKQLLKRLCVNKELKFPVSSIRCFKSNGGGLFNEANSPTGDNELMFLIIRDIDSTGSFSNFDIR